MEEINFKVIQGDTFTIVVTYKNPDGSVIDITDFSARMDVRDKPGGKVLCASATQENGGVTIDGPNGQLTIEFTPSQTKKFTIPSAAHQLKITNLNSNQETTLVQGYLQVSSAVIR
jgi:hypothetical protein